MKTVQIVVLCILVFLAVSSGITKVLLMPQDVEFFGEYGFTNAILILFGAVQVIGGVMMVFLKTRAVGAAIVGVTFAISAVLLVLSGSVLAALVTVVALGLLGLIVRQSLARD